MRDPRDALSAAQVGAWLGHALALSDLCRRTIEQVSAAGLSVERKADRSLVTSADRAAEQAVRASAAERTPEAGVLGEEFGQSRPEAEFTWVIDPIDGTAEFAAGLPLWGTIIGLWYRGLPLAGVIDHPALGRRAHAAWRAGAYLDGQRLVLEDLPATGPSGTERIGTPSRTAFVKFRDAGARFDALARTLPNLRIFHTCLTHTSAASGALDAALEWDAPDWDLGATRILVEEAGGAYRTLSERVHPELGRVSSAVFGRPRLVEAIAALLEG